MDRTFGIKRYIKGDGMVLYSRHFFLMLLVNMTFDEQVLRRACNGNSLGHNLGIIKKVNKASSKVLHENRLKCH